MIERIRGFAAIEMGILHFPGYSAGSSVNTSSVELELLLSPGNLILHPQRFFAAMRHDLPIGQALTLLVLLPILFGACCILSRMLSRGFINPSDLKEQANFLLGATVVLLGCTIMLAFLDLSILRMFRSQISFDWLLCVIVFATAPSWLIGVPYGLLQIDYFTFRLMKAAWVAGAVWTTVLLWIGIRAESSFAWWQILVLIAPFLTVLWAICVNSVRERSEVLHAVLPWRKHNGESVTIYYSRSRAGDGIPELVRCLDRALADATRLLGVNPLGFRVPVFLFPSIDLLQRSVTNAKSVSAAWGYAHVHAISLTDDPDVSKLHSGAAHEFAHILRKHRIHPKLYGLLDEGLACFVENALFGTQRCVIHGPESWRIMARYTLFFEWNYVEQPEHPPFRNYAYAYMVAAYLINTFGMPKYLELCRKAATDKECEVGEKLEQAVKTVYGRPVRDLEAEWRRSFAESEVADGGQDNPVEQRRRIDALESRLRALEAHIGGQLLLKYESEDPKHRSDHANPDVNEDPSE